jgi:predicted alpha/beta-hydrolase family hydrolase
MADGLVLTHGAGGNCEAPLLIAVEKAFVDAGYQVQRFDLAFRKRGGAPLPATSGKDRDSIREAVAAMRKLVDGKVIAGGHSYGGRQSTMLAAEEPGLVDGLLLLSYPLHPPNKPEQLRTDHFPSLQTPAVFVHGTRDPFGTIDEMRAALSLIQAKTELVVIEGATHDLKRGRFDLAQLTERFGRGET